MDSSRIRRARVARRWIGVAAGALGVAGLLGGTPVCGQDFRQPILNPFTSKARPATVRPLAEATSEEPQPTQSGKLRPASIRPVGEAIENPHASSIKMTEATETTPRQRRSVPLIILNESVNSHHAPPTILNESLPTKSAPLTILNESIQTRPAPLTDADVSESEQPAPLTVVNDSIELLTLPAPSEEEHLAPIVSASDRKRRPGKMPSAKRAPGSAAPSAEPAADRPHPPPKTIRRAEKAAAFEEAPGALEPRADAELANLTAADTPLGSAPVADEWVVREPAAAARAADDLAPLAPPFSELAAVEPAVDAPPAIGAQPLAPIVSAAIKVQQPRALPAGSPAPSPTRTAQLIDRPAPRTLLVQSEAQPDQPQPAPAEPLPAGPALPEGSPFETIQESGTLKVQVRRSLLLRTQKDIFRTAVVDDAVCEIVQFTPRELSIIGRSQGSTHVTFWFDDPAMQPVTYVVEILPDSKQVQIEEEKYRLLEDVLNEMFPDSKIKLTLVADKLIARGQAKDSEEAFAIMTIIRGQAGYRGGMGNAASAGINEGQAAQVLSDTVTGAARRANYQIVNMLRVPGVQQVALRVKIAELNRSAARNFGLDIKGTIDVNDSSKILLNSLSSVATGEAPPILFNVDGDDITIGLNALQQHGVVKLLSEPTLVTMSGRPATFLAGGEFAVPTVVGSAGLNAVTTDFRAFGAIISFLPTVVDKDRIRLEVAPEFSEINSDLSTGGSSTGSIPSLNVRAATTTVEMREGQTLAIAGLLQDSMTANNAGDLPFLQRIIGRRSVTRNENELIILVTPELVHPMEPEEVPPLPGFDVTEPTNTQFYLHGDLEGNPTMDYRSTVWPRLKKRYKAGGPAMTSGPFGHGQ